MSQPSDDASASGLSAAEAAARLKAEGPNELPRQGKRSILAIAFSVVREPMFGMLLAAGVIYLLLGDKTEALLLLGFASISVLITIVQEVRSERVLEALRDLTSPRALVVRDGERVRIPGREVVRGDLLIIGEGDRVAADALLTGSNDLELDESLLTGESVPVRKHATAFAQATAKMPAPGGEDFPAVFAGTLAVRGQGTAIVLATGAKSEIGKIGQSLSTIESATPRLTRETRSIVRVFAVIGLICCTLAVLLFGLLRGSWLNALLAGIALGMSMLPEEFPLVLTVFMVMGAWRLSRERVLTRRAPAIETLGAVTVLCTDKTGTLTQNRMSIVELRTPDETLKLSGARNISSESLLALIDRGRLASAPEPFDPMERAFHALHGETDLKTNGDLSLIKTYPVRPELLAMTQAWLDPSDNRHLVSVKGAPEAVIALCRLSDDETAKIKAQVDEMAAEGERVLAIAEARDVEALPDSPHAFDFRYLGLVGLADPLRETVRNAVEQCRSAGIRIVMITGDYPQTAKAIAAQAGLEASSALDGATIARLSDAELAAAVKKTSVFARIMPDQKLRLVDSLKRAGEVVGMTGDGVNDAPALRAADIGIAMGGRGTDVAREAASIVLLDDDFGSIVRTVRLGRRIYDNLRKAMTYILAIHIPIAGMALLPLLIGSPIILLPVHIAFLEMVIDPVCSIVFEAEREEADIMRRPPRSPLSRLLSRNLMLWGLVQGVLALTVTAFVYLFAVGRGLPGPDIRALSFVTLVLVNLALVWVNRSYASGLIAELRRPNLALGLITAAVALVLAAAVTWPPAERLFGFGTFHSHDLAISVGAAIGVILVLDVLKRFVRKKLVV